MIDQETAIKMASRFLLDRIDSYQIMPLDDFGNIDWEAYEPGCTNWNILQDMKISEAIISDAQLDDDDDWTVEISGTWQWSEAEGAEEEFCFEVYIPKDANLNCDNDFEFERFS